VQICSLGLEIVFRLVSLITSNYTSDKDHLEIIKPTSETHKPRTGPINPIAWKEIKVVPGHKQWKEDSYPRHPEIELVPLANKSEN